MPIYEYQAKEMNGETVFGTEKAKSKEELAKLLMKKNLILISTDGNKENKRKIFKLKSGKIKLTDKMIFTRHLSVMIGAGFPFDKSLDVLANQAESDKFKEVISKMREDVLRGEQFSEALKKHPQVFSELYVNMVRVAEETGNLKDVLETLAEQMKKDQEVISKVKGAMMYPIVLLCLMAVIGTGMMIFILPQFSKTFEEMEVETPVITQIILSFGDYLAKFWYLIPVIIVLLVFLFIRVKKSKKGKLAFDKLSLKIPVVGQIFKKLNTARTARTLSSLIKSGVPIVKSLNILSTTLTNKLYKDALRDVADQIQKGRTLKESLISHENLFSFLLIQMVEVGEETGNMGEVLNDLADFYETELDRITKNLSTIIEPVLMVIIGIAVAVFAISIIGPMYSMMNRL
ncbi:MAG: type II secretion system F family protein [Candidatus Pacebacteria bacterium]|nr:type II secretion system F family protein [Candidatus Paceibacterota bacterium]